ncbi:hypothetical protein [Paracoccus spongiarum]|uniref:DUF4282 domain-containing protein n=1 Tax=Paracoccus spongiarum TaxID=3064387 RepID=A0ABT9J834_9RHOB|nr:hypothetical protein [Paracoccus sp. 2205BS29-5]MDP5305900.1 hypothetical protein [Paracoccus sp. 2205BS29-5]
MSLKARITSLAQRDAVTTVGLAVSAVWLLLVLLFWLLAPGGEGGAGGLARLVGAVGVVMPLMMVWVAVALARSIAVLRAEAQDLRLRLTQLREYAATRGAPPAVAGEATGRVVPAQGAQGQTPQPSAPLPPPQQTPAAPRPRPADQRQAAMRFDAPESVQVDPGTLIRALDFPDGPDDHEAIAALRMALKDLDNSRVLRAAQDVVTLLAAQSVYMDDLPPDPAPAAVWRRLADGARGSAVAALGGIHDELALDVASSLLRGDEIFRDAAHHFLRHFDAMVCRLVPQLDDAQVAVLAQTRSARAFMLLGRVAGIFG